MIIAFGTYDTARHPRVAVLIEGLRAHGHEVVELNRPLGFSTAARVRMLQQPWRLPALVWRLVRRWWGLIGDARRLKRSGTPADVVMVGYLGHFDVLLARLLFRRSQILLDHLVFAGDTAQDRGAGGLKVRLLNALDRHAIRTADVTIVDTPDHLDMLPASATGVVVPVGAREEWFDAARDAPGGRPVSVVFFGLFTPLQGAPSIAEGIALALEHGAPLRATMIGTGQDWVRARGILGDRPGVTWIDWVEPHELPAVVAGHDICLGVFGAEGKGLRVVPNKVYEAAAAGCAVITSDTPPQRAILGDAACFVAPGDAAAIAAAIERLASDAELLRERRAAIRAQSCRFHAEQVIRPLLPLVRAAR